jgi:acyl-CoA thioesterase FadM
MNKVFYAKKTLTFREADPAGIMFFGNVFAFAHDAFEEFIVAAGYAHNEWFGKFEYIIPIRQTEANFLSPFLPGQTYQIAVSVAKLGETSFQMKYVFSKENKTHAIVTMVHAVAHRENLTKMPVPVVIRQRLQPYLEATEKSPIV